MCFLEHVLIFVLEEACCSFSHQTLLTKSLFSLRCNNVSSVAVLNLEGYFCTFFRTFVHSELPYQWINYVLSDNIFCKSRHQDTHGGRRNDFWWVAISLSMILSYKTRPQICLLDSEHLSWETLHELSQVFIMFCNWIWMTGSLVL